MEVPPLPNGCEHLWQSFLQLNASRGSNGMGPAAIGPADLLAWQQLQGIALTPWEVGTLFALDACALKASDDAQKAASAQAPKPLKGQT